MSSASPCCGRSRDSATPGYDRPKTLVPAGIRERPFPAFPPNPRTLSTVESRAARTKLSALCRNFDPPVHRAGENFSRTLDEPWGRGGSELAAEANDLGLERLVAAGEVP